MHIQEREVEGIVQVGKKTGGENAGGRKNYGESKTILTENKEDLDNREEECNARKKQQRITRSQKRKEDEGGKHTEEGIVKTRVVLSQRW